LTPKIDRDVFPGSANQVDLHIQSSRHFNVSTQERVPLRNVRQELPHDEVSGAAVRETSAKLGQCTEVKGGARNSGNSDHEWQRAKQIPGLKAETWDYYSLSKSIPVSAKRITADAGRG
jgi:hypothetical protein